jgi:hypothetical protein
MIRLRRDRGWSQEALAFECGLHRTFIAHCGEDGAVLGHQERLTALMVRQRELARELDLDKDEAGTQVLDDASEESIAA